MNKKFTVITEHKTKAYCVVDTNVDLCDQLLEVMDIRKGTGFCVKLTDETIELVDYFNASSCAEFKIVSVEETDEPISLKWEKCEK